MKFERKYSTMETSPHHRLGRRHCFIIQPLVSACLANQDLCWCLWLWSEPMGGILSSATCGHMLLCWRLPLKFRQNKLGDVFFFKFSFTFKNFFQFTMSECVNEEPDKCVCTPLHFLHTLCFISSEVLDPTFYTSGDMVNDVEITHLQSCSTLGLAAILKRSWHDWF